MMAPGTLDTHLATFLRKVSGEAKSQIVALLGAVHARRDLAVGAVDEAPGLGLSGICGEDTVVVAAEVVHCRRELPVLWILEVR